MTSFTAIVAAYDFSAPAEAALDLAASLARDHRATLRVVFVQPRTPTRGTAGPVAGPAFPAGMAEMQRVEEEARAAAEKNLNARVAPLRSDIQVEVEAVVDLAARALVDRTREADLLVLGAHQRSLLAEMAVGSVERPVVRRATCPVLLVPEPEESGAASGTTE